MSACGGGGFGRSVRGLASGGRLRAAGGAGGGGGGGGGGAVLTNFTSTIGSSITFALIAADAVMIAAMRMPWKSVEPKT